jgi:hypothetical protein
MAKKVQQPQSKKPTKERIQQKKGAQRKRNRAANGILKHTCRQKEHEIVESNKHLELSRGPTTLQKLQEHILIFPHHLLTREEWSSCQTHPKFVQTKGFFSM